MNRKLILAVLVALAGSAIFGGIMAYRPHLTESWMRAIASGFAFVVMIGSFVLAVKLKDSD